MAIPNANVKPIVPAVGLVVVLLTTNSVSKTLSYGLDDTNETIKTLIIIPLTCLTNIWTLSFSLYSCNKLIFLLVI